MQPYKTVFFTGLFQVFTVCLRWFPPFYVSIHTFQIPHTRDVIWGSPGAHIITKCTKNMQVSGQVQVLQLPFLSNGDLCPVRALKTIVSTNAIHADKIWHISRATVLTASRVRRVLNQVLTSLGLPLSLALSLSLSLSMVTTHLDTQVRPWLSTITSGSTRPKSMVAGGSTPFGDTS